MKDDSQIKPITLEEFRFSNGWHQCLGAVYGLDLYSSFNTNAKIYAKRYDEDMFNLLIDDEINVYKLSISDKQFKMMFPQNLYFIKINSFMNTLEMDERYEIAQMLEYSLRDDKEKQIIALFRDVSCVKGDEFKSLCISICGTELKAKEIVGKLVLVGVLDYFVDEKHKLVWELISYEGDQNGNV